MHNHNVFGRPVDESLQKKTRVFISHRAADKEYASAIASYFENIGLHYYFDEQDEDLLRVTRDGASEAAGIVAAIERGLAHSTHLLAVLSRRTMGSWWVPFEIGTARATGKDVRHLLLSSITTDMVPEYLRVYPQLWTADDLFSWVSALTPWREHLVEEQYSDYLSDIFGELDPDEETIESWYSAADHENKKWLKGLDATFKKDSSSA